MAENDVKTPDGINLAQQPAQGLGASAAVAPAQVAPSESAENDEHDAHEFGKRARHETAKKGVFERCHMYVEFASFLALIVTCPIALMELHNHANEMQKSVERERNELSENTYRYVDDRFMDFMKLCLDNPRLDCYSVARAEKLRPPLTEDEKWQQRILYSALTDVFEVAYVQYHKEAVSQKIKKLFDDQWDGWDAYIRKFLARQSYKAVWFDIRGEYDKNYIQYVDGIAPPPRK